MQAPRDTNHPTCLSLPRVEYGALLVSFKPEAHFVLDTNGKPENVLENEEEVDNQNEVLEMVAVSYPPNFFTELSSLIGKESSVHN